MREMMPSYAGKKVMGEQEKMTLEERKNELWDAFNSYPEAMHVTQRDYAPYGWDLNDDYKPN